MDKVLLTGATGFIGNAVSKCLKDFRGVVRTGCHHNFDDYYQVDWIDGRTDWKGAFNEIECVLHLAGLAHNKSFTDAQYHSVNYEGTIKLALDAVNSGVKRFVYVSSIGVNGSTSGDKPFSASSKPNAHNAYSRSKLKAEQGLKEISMKTGLEVIIVRPTLVYGPKAPGNFGSLTKLVKKSPMLPFGLSDNLKDFIFVRNLADLLVVCSKHSKAPGHIFLASDVNTVSIKEFTNAIAKGLNKKVIQLPVPISLLYLTARLVGKYALAEQLLGNLQVDSSDAQEVLGWVAPYTIEQAMNSLSEGEK